MLHETNKCKRYENKNVLKYKYLIAFTRNKIWDGKCTIIYNRVLSLFVIGFEVIGRKYYIVMNSWKVDKMVIKI